MKILRSGLRMWDRMVVKPCQPLTFKIGHCCYLDVSIVLRLEVDFSPLYRQALIQANVSKRV